LTDYELLSTIITGLGLSIIALGFVFIIFFANDHSDSILSIAFAPLEMGGALVLAFGMITTAPSPKVQTTLEEFL
jgi:hypothetical protein